MEREGNWTDRVVVIVVSRMTRTIVTVEFYVVPQSRVRPGSSITRLGRHVERLGSEDLWRQGTALQWLSATGTLKPRNR